jgi:hypothetical protein
MRKIRVYVDASVFGGTRDDEFRKESCIFFDRVQAGEYKVLISDETIRELDDAPEEVQSYLLSIPGDRLEIIPIDREVEELANQYIEAEVIGRSHLGDAKHVAAASIAGADLILSWNFKHIVSFKRIRGFNGVNMLLGYRTMTILSPREVVEDEK